jgi:hypothetical protein
MNQSDEFNQNNCKQNMEIILQNILACRREKINHQGGKRRDFFLFTFSYTFLLMIYFLPSAC